MLCDIDGQSGFTHRRARRQHNQVSRLHARKAAVQVVEPGRHTSDVAGVIRHLLHAVQQLNHKRVHALKALFVALTLLADIEDPLLRLVHNLGHRAALGVECVGGNLVTGADKLAQDGTVTHDLGVTPDIAGTGYVLGQ